MSSNRTSNWMLSFKKIGYWLWLLPVALVPLSYYLAQNSAHADAWAFLAPIQIFSLMPLLDALLGRERASPDESLQVQAMENELYYRVLTLACVPVLFGLLGWGGWILAHDQAWSWTEPCRLASPWV
jgi:alkane 1-monooxygenase